jgi:hypothetical protein
MTSSARTNSPFLFRILVKPVRNHLSDSFAILFKHHGVYITVQTGFLQTRCVFRTPAWVRNFDVQ